ncbi:PspC domain-containing protein [Sphingomonas sediminicola]|uniref:PspC domain-containing protein n=1 Tax=Sphingomonas sediminicola TaxID=386874 RepID=A0ABX6T8B1_9SPHN|nr:PspC domain-containing protein [Sphingomonas sediminicola]QNP46087.1 PspC domain-containing protein [Sphingomonas sediminicola]
MARYNYRYSMDRREKKVAGVCSTFGEVFNIDPTFIRIGFVAAAILVSWKLALIAYVGAGIYMHIQRNKATRGYERSQLSDYDRMENVARVRPTVHALRTQLDETDRRLMAIDDHINSTNDELAREIEALREEK